MIPTFSPSPDVIPAVIMQHSPILPPFTPHTKIRDTYHNSPWKHSRRLERFPPLAKSSTAWKETHRGNAYEETQTMLSPTPTTDQNKSFQSTTILRSVPIMRRHLDTFGGRTFSLPAKTKAVPIHTGRFIFDPHNKPIFFEELTQNQRLQAEIAMVEKVRGLKRKREALQYKWRKLDLYGVEMSRAERYSLQAEVKKLKELILPTTARDIYTGRGIRLPESHHTKRPMRQPTPGEPPQPPPPSTVLPLYREPFILKSSPPPPPLPRHQFTGTKTSRSRERVVFKQISQPPPSTHHTVDLLAQKIPVSGISVSPIPRQTTDKMSARATTDFAQEPTPQPTPALQTHEPLEQVEVIEPQPGAMVEDDITDKIEKQPTPLVPETPVDRSRSMAGPSASPEHKGQFNPLISVSALEDSITTEEEYTNLQNTFAQLSKDNQGSITFEQLISVCPSSLTQPQRSFLQSLYNLSNQNATFGTDEFIAMTSVAHKVINLNPSTQAMFEQINFATLEESLTQYTELFSSVDRTGRGRIGVGALLQILSTTLNRQLEPDTKLAQQIMETMQKEYSSDVPRLDFLVYIPYFLYLEEMT